MKFNIKDINYIGIIIAITLASAALIYDAKHKSIWCDDFFKKHLKNPRKNKEKKDEVIVFVEIIIENDGIIYEMSSIGPEIYRTQVEKVVKKLPELFPAKIDNYPVAVTYSFPVKFNLK